MRIAEVHFDCERQINNTSVIVTLSHNSLFKRIKIMLRWSYSLEMECDVCVHGYVGSYV